MEGEIRRFSKDVCGSAAIYDWRVVKEWDGLDLPLPWTFLQYQCEKCQHQKTVEKVFKIVAIQAYKPITDMEEVKDTLVWMGVNENGNLSFLPPEFVKFFTREVLQLPEGVAPV